MEAFASDYSRIIDMVGTIDFYDAVVRFVGALFNCPRHLVARYGQYSRPEFILNRSMPSAAMRLYYEKLYRIDPIVKLVRTKVDRPVMSFAEIKQNAIDTFFYEESFQTQQIYDELLVMLEAVGGIWFAVCVDRDDSMFSSEEIALARAVYPMLQRLNRLHVESSLREGCRGFIDGSTMAVLVVDEAGQPVSDSLKRSQRRAPSVQDLRELTAGSSVGTLMINAHTAVHWNPLLTHHAFAPNGKVIVVEDRSPGYLDVTGGDWTARFSGLYGLTPRESQIVGRILKGSPSSLIADVMGVSVGTIRNHKHRIYEKLDITSERELFVAFYTMLTDPP